MVIAARRLARCGPTRSMDEDAGRSGSTCSARVVSNALCTGWPRGGRPVSEDAEKNRLEQARAGSAAWKAWGPYLSERQWGTVREDYSDNGDAWNYFTHDQARSRAYRWGEDGLGGISDSH